MNEIGGSIFPVEPYYALTDTGLVQETKYQAVSSWTGEKVVFFTLSAATFWLQSISSHCLWANIR